MSSNPEPIMQQLEHDFKELVGLVSGPEAFRHSAYSVELRLFRGLLALGKALLQLFFITRAAQVPSTPVLAPSGQALRYHHKLSRDYYSVFGKLSFTRPYYYLKGEAGSCPLDAELSLPRRCYSDLLREWATYGAAESSFRDSTKLLKRILGLSLSLQVVETMSYEDAADAKAFYDQASFCALPSSKDRQESLGSKPASAPPSPELEAAAVLVVQADGKGVPMVQAPAKHNPPRLAKGQKRGTKKEAIVTTLYNVAPYPRTPQEVVTALFRQACPAEATHRPAPVDKELRACLDGKAAAITRLAARAAWREGAFIAAKVALTDGAEALQQQMLSQFPDYTLILDIIHASEYLWDSANALLGEKHPERIKWVRQHLEAVLSGRTREVIAALQQEALKAGCSQAQQQVLLRTIGYYQRNLPYMRYNHYLAQGWPIGTGVVEGACGHLVKDRMEQSGMRWSKDGAQAVLDLRALQLSGHWDSYWQFHRQQQHHNLYGSPLPAQDSPEAQVFQLAA